MHLRIARLQRTQQIFVITDLQIGVQPALKKNSGAAELQHLVDFLEDFLERQDVAVFRAEWAVERAEGAILRAEICVVDVAVDLVVTTRGSFFFRRSWCAAIPMPTRSSDSSISKASCFVSP